MTILKNYIFLKLYTMNINTHPPTTSNRVITFGWQCSPQSHRLSNKNSSTRNGKSWVVVQYSTNDSPNNISYRYCLWLPLRGWRYAVVAEETKDLGHRTWLTWIRIILKLSFLWNSFHSIRNYYTNCQVRETIYSSF